MKSKTYDHIAGQVRQGKKLFAVLIDPDKYSVKALDYIVNHPTVDLIFVGGSLVNSNASSEKLISEIKMICDKPVLLFPGSINQVTANADALLFLSLISGRNPEMLIGQHVVMAPAIKKMNLETIPTGYMLFESGRLNTAQYISQSLPLPADKPDVASATAMAGEMLGLKMIYMDAGSGASKPINRRIISDVRKHVNIPIIVGGGIVDPEQAGLAYNAGADVVVIGNKLEETPELLEDMAMIKS